MFTDAMEKAYREGAVARNTDVLHCQGLSNSNSSQSFKLSLVLVPLSLHNVRYY